jgi:hypothetical protein
MIFPTSDFLFIISGLSVFLFEGGKEDSLALRLVLYLDASIWDAGTRDGSVSHYLKWGACIPDASILV